MILFLYGEDTYRSKQKLDAIKSKYIDASLGDTNLSVADFADKDIDFTQISRMILAFPFLAKNRLVVLRNLLSKGNKKLLEQMSTFLSKIPESTHLVFYEEDIPDRRTALFKKLTQPISPEASRGLRSQEFKTLESYQLRKWIDEEVRSRGGEIESAAVDKLVQYVGNDLWRLANEIQKVISYTLHVTSADIELLVKPKIEGNIFGMIDALGQKNSGQALNMTRDLIATGENELYILTMIVYQFRNLLIIKDISNNRQPSTINKFQIAKQSGLNPYVVEKTIHQAKNFTFDQLKNIYHKLLDYDIKMKTGALEPKLGLDMLIVELCN